MRVNFDNLIEANGVKYAPGEIEPHEDGTVTLHDVIWQSDVGWTEPCTVTVHRPYTLLTSDGGEEK